MFQQNMRPVSLFVWDQNEDEEKKDFVTKTCQRDITREMVTSLGKHRGEEEKNVVLNLYIQSKQQL